MTKFAILHVGPYKTGSTAIQAVCMDKREVLGRYGVVYPPHHHIGGHYTLICKGVSGIMEAVVNQGGHLLISSEILSGLSHPEMADLYEGLKEYGYTPIAISICRSFYDVFVSANKNWLRDNDGSRLSEVNYRTMQMNPAYSHNMVERKLRAHFGNDRVVINYSDDVVWDFLVELVNILDLPKGFLNEMRSGAMGRANQSTNSGLEWAYFHLSQLESFKGLTEEQQKNIHSEFFARKWGTDFLSFSAQCKRC